MGYDAYKNSMGQFKDKIGSGQIAVADAARRPEGGLATGNVGQRPFDMGYKVMYALKDMSCAARSDLYRARHLHAEERGDLHRRREVS
jgi:hypothetical protein